MKISHLTQIGNMTNDNESNNIVTRMLLQRYKKNIQSDYNTLTFSKKD